MLTRFKVSGFKNLVDVDVQFGPFTCIAGPNGVGKSNLFDAIRFLSDLADNTLLDAAKMVRDESGRSTDVRSLFHWVGPTHDKTMSFDVEMVIPRKGVDDFGRPCEASSTLLRYRLDLAYGANGDREGHGGMEIMREELSRIVLNEAGKHLGFLPKGSMWRQSAITAFHGRNSFISTEGEGAERTIRLHGDQYSGPPEPRAAKLPRTVLSGVNSAESPTVLLAKREMQSWRILHLEPSCLCKPDELNATPHLSSDGSHLAATLYRLAKWSNGEGRRDVHEAAVYARIENRLAQLIEDVRAVSVDSDSKRELLTLEMIGADGTRLPSRALSEGTLRFLALAVLEQDPEEAGLICLEEPENGIHPERIPAMLQLLESISTDTNEPVGEDNPLRQVIVNTHSPLVVAEVRDDCLLFARLCDTLKANQRFKRACFSCLTDTWRAKEPAESRTIPKGELLRFLSPVMPLQKRNRSTAGVASEVTRTGAGRRVVDRKDLQAWLFGE
jgi:predicted ATPase